MLQQPMAKLKIQRVRIGDDQVAGIGRERSDRSGGVRRHQPRHAFGNGVGKARGRGVDPGQVKAGQRGEDIDQRPPDMAGTPEADLVLPLRQRLDHPAVDQRRDRQDTFTARAGDQTAHGQRGIGRCIGSYRPGQQQPAAKGRNRSRIMHLGQKRDHAPAALTKRGAKGNALEQRRRATLAQDGARPQCCLPFKRAAANGAFLPVFPDQY